MTVVVFSLTHCIQGLQGSVGDPGLPGSPGLLVSYLCYVCVASVLCLCCVCVIVQEHRCVFTVVCVVPGHAFSMLCLVIPRE